MAPQQVGETVTVNGELYRVAKVKSSNEYGSKFYGRWLFSLVKFADQTGWSAYGKRVSHNSRLRAIDPESHVAAARRRVREELDLGRAVCARCGVVIGGRLGEVTTDGGGAPVPSCKACPVGVNFTTAYPVGTEIMITSGFAAGCVARIEGVTDAYPPNLDGIAYYACRAYVITLAGWGQRSFVELVCKPTDDADAARYAVARDVPFEADMPDAGPEPTADRTQLAEARGWIADCGADASELSDADVVGVVERHYGGGWEQFGRDTDVCAAFLP